MGRKVKFDRRTLLGGAAISVATGLIGQASRAAGSYDPGANDSEIRIGQFGPLSGPVSSFGLFSNYKVRWLQPKVAPAE
jgi:branched-chain amino acid transport system substrate-binding protein